MGKPKLRTILAAKKGKVPYIEKQKKLQKEARKRKRTHEKEGNEEEILDGLKLPADVQVNGSNDEEEAEGWEDESSDEEDERVIDTSRIDDSDSDSDATEDEVMDAGKFPINGNSKEDEDDEEEEEEGSDIALSDIDEDDQDPDADVIPRQRLTIDNHPALLSAQSSIAIPTKKLPFSAHQSITTAAPVEIKDVDDDLTRELAFYTQALDAAKRGRELLLAEGMPFTRPTDYFAEMVKSEEHMGKIKDKMKEEAAAKRASADAKRQRDLKKFGKQVQVARLQERQKEKRVMLDKIQILKRKRAGADLGDENEDDPFDIAIEKATKATGRDSRDKRNQNRAPNAKRQKKNEKFGFGGRKKFAKSGDAVSSGDLSGFNTKGMKKNSFGGGGKKPRLGKSKRQGKR